MKQSQKFLTILEAINSNIKLSEKYLEEKGIKQTEFRILMEELDNSGMVNDSNEITIDGVEFLMQNERNEILKKIVK